MFCEHLFQYFFKSRLIAFDGEEIIGSVLKEDLSGRVIIGMQRIGQYHFPAQLQLSKQLPGCGDFIGFFRCKHRTQKTPLSIDRIDDLTFAMAQFFSVEDHQIVFG